MPNFDIIRQSKPKESFRVASVMGKFDLQSNEVRERFTGSIEMPENWQIGLIVGNSGTGKTTIAKELFPDAYVTNFAYTDRAIIDDMPERKTVDEITQMFGSVGFSSPPSWLKPYSVLSNGQKMRVDLANALLQDKDLIVFDEFTSVVDRTVAQVGSFAVQKAIRKTKKQFIAVSCHFDVEPWVLPDWVFDCNTMTFRTNEGLKKNRPAINFEVFKTADKSIWNMFARHHYLSHTHNNSAEVYVAFVNNNLAGFCSVLHFPHPSTKLLKKIHRLVILPDFQGIGFGSLFLQEVAKVYKSKGYRITIVTSHPALAYGLKINKDWACIRYGRTGAAGKTTTKTTNFNKFVSSVRITTSWEFTPQKDNRLTPCQTRDANPSQRS